MRVPYIFLPKLKFNLVPLGNNHIQPYIFFFLISKDGYFVIRSCGHIFECYLYLTLEHFNNNNFAKNQKGTSCLGLHLRLFFLKGGEGWERDGREQNR